MTIRRNTQGYVLCSVTPHDLTIVRVVSWTLNTSSHMTSHLRVSWTFANMDEPCAEVSRTHPDRQNEFEVSIRRWVMVVGWQQWGRPRWMTGESPELWAQLTQRWLCGVISLPTVDCGWWWRWWWWGVCMVGGYIVNTALAIALPRRLITPHYHSPQTVAHLTLFITHHPASHPFKVFCFFCFYLQLLFAVVSADPSSMNL